MVEKIIEGFKDVGVSKNETLRIMNIILETPDINVDKIDNILKNELSIQQYIEIKNLYVGSC